MGDSVESPPGDRDEEEGGSEPLSIGEVLAVLAEEFPDVTVSKIRFLESQGLVNPDRNASGYRQFDDSDIERLRWILRQQRDRFLPLKVIKRALDNGVDVVDAGSDQPTLWTAVADDEVDRIVREAESEPVAPTPRAPMRHPAAREVGERSRHATPADVVAALQEDPRPKAPHESSAEPQDPSGTPPAPSRTEVAADPPQHAEQPASPAGGSGAKPANSIGAATAFDRDELLAATSIDADALAALEDFGLVVPSEVGGEPSYDESDLLICQAAARCAELGLGPRHLRIYKVAAVREAGLVEQLVMPMVKQRNPEARAEAGRTVAELTDLGARVHAALLARELGPLAPEQR